MIMDDSRIFPELIILYCLMQKVEQKSEPEELLRILHFNDVYDIEPGDKDPVGGVARFKTAIDSLRD